MLFLILLSKIIYYKQLLLSIWFYKLLTNKNKVLRKLLMTWFPTKVQEFCDLCAVSNISVYILDENVHGYYIHGASPLGKGFLVFKFFIKKF